MSELKIWANIAEIYSLVSAGKTLAQKNEFFALLLRATMTSEEHIFHVYTPKAISRMEAEHALYLLYQNAA